MSRPGSDPAGTSAAPLGGSARWIRGVLRETGGAPGFSKALVAAFGVWYITLVLVIPRDLVLNGLLDDSFYYLHTARNIVAGLGSSFDGVEATNGYHPLWMILLLIPARLLTGHPDSLVRVGLLLGAVFGLGSLLLVRHILIRTAGAWAATVGILLFAWPRFFGQTLNLLETSLLLFLYAVLASLLLCLNRNGADNAEGPCIRAPLPSRSSSGGGKHKAVESPSAEFSDQASRRILIGLLLGLASLARLDTVFLLIAFGICGALEAWREGRSRGFIRALWIRLLPLVVASAVVLPYLVWNLTRFGHLQPVSGAAKSGFPVPDFQPGLLLRHPEFALLLLVGTGFFLASLKRPASAMVRMLGLFGLAGLLHMAYTLLFMRWGVDRWHFVLMMPAGLLGIPWLMERMLSRPSSGGSRWIRTSTIAIGVIAAVIVQGSSLMMRGGRHLAAVREAALWAADNLPEDTVFAMSDAGVFAYYGRRTTVNLDGLINSYDYLDALRTGRVSEYLHHRGVDYIFDQSAYGVPGLLDGTYEERTLRLWYRPRSRVAAEIIVRREDEVYRRDILSRPAALSRPEPNSLILYVLDPKLHLP